MIEVLEKEIEEKLTRLYKRIHTAAKISGRSYDEIKIIAISKGQSVQSIVDIFNCGQRAFGENYVQEAISKQEELTDLPIQWHFTGHLQTKKVKDIIGRFEYIHTIDSIKLVNVFARLLMEKQVTQKVLIQVNIGNEVQKFGVTIAEVQQLSEVILNVSSLNLCGFMCLPPKVKDVEVIRMYFTKLRELRDQLEVTLGVRFPELSMGMSNDFVYAIEEGATFIRIGSDIFGQ